MLPAHASLMLLLTLSLTAGRAQADAGTSAGATSPRFHPVSAADLHDPSDPNQRLRPAIPNQKSLSLRAARDPHWTQFRIDALRNEKRQ
ncbi:MAG: hypothetical protein AAF436_18340, partial [Myxococcota bacterium]